MCPYFNTDHKTCAFFDTHQEGDQREYKCLSSSEWKYCLNYSNRTYEEKVSKRLRPNPEL